MSKLTTSGLMLIVLASLAFALAPDRDADWPRNGGVDNIRYSGLNQINRDNVSRLQVAWTYDSHDAFKGSEMQSNPIVVSGVLYATTPTMQVVALNAETGNELWTFDPSGGSGTRTRFRHRGVTVHNDRVLVSYRNFLLALNKRTGQPITSFGVDGRIDLREGLDRPAERMNVSDRRTGEPLFPIENRKVPASTVDGEQLADLQPYPVKPPPFARQGLTEEMLTTRTPDAHAAVLARFRKMKAGMFMPPSLEGTIVFPGFDGGAEWGGAAFDPETALLYVNSNEMPWIIRLIPNNDTALYNSKCATCHREDRQGSPAVPSLIGVGDRRSREEIATIIRQGTGQMPGFPDMGSRNVNDLVEFLVTGRDKGADPNLKNDPNWLKYRSDGESIFLDPDGYPAITPPWGTLNAIDLNAGTIRWKVPFGEFPDLAAKGLTNTGSDNYGGPVVTAGGLLFIGATNFDKKFRAYDKLTGKLIWETTLPAAGNATPSTYQVNGRQYVAIVCGGGKNGAPSGSSIVAFALPARSSSPPDARARRHATSRASS